MITLKQNYFLISEVRCSSRYVFCWQVIPHQEKPLQRGVESCRWNVSVDSLQ